MCLATSPSCTHRQGSWLISVSLRASESVLRVAALTGADMTPVQTSWLSPSCAVFGEKGTPPWAASAGASSPEVPHTSSSQWLSPDHRTFPEPVTVTGQVKLRVASESNHLAESRGLGGSEWEVREADSTSVMVPGFQGCSEN